MPTVKRLDKSLSQLIKEADAVFSEYIRMKARDENGLVRCFICATRIPWRQSQAMHFIDRDQMAVRYDEMNVHEGCADCNCFDPEHPNKYYIWMVEKYGLAKVNELTWRSRGLQKFMRHELLELIDIYKHKLKELR